MRTSIFSLNGQLDSLQAFLAEDRPREGDDRKSENTLAGAGSRPSSTAPTSPLVALQWKFPNGLGTHAK